MKKVKLQIDNSKNYWSIESACISVTSPTGKTIWLEKSFISINMPEKLKNIYWKFADIKGETEATIEEMQLLLLFSKLTVRNMKETYNLEILK